MVYDQHTPPFSILQPELLVKGQDLLEWAEVSSREYFQLRRAEEAEVRCFWSGLLRQLRLTFSLSWPAQRILSGANNNLLQ